MTHKDIHVGIVGANAKAGWAKLSHIPAINGLPGLKLAAVATRNGAREAAEAFGAERWFSDPFASFQHALHNARLIDAVRRAAKRGERQKVCFGMDPAPLTVTG